MVLYFQEFKVVMGKDWRTQQAIKNWYRILAEKLEGKRIIWKLLKVGGGEIVRCTLENKLGDFQVHWKAKSFIGQETSSWPVT